MPAETEIVTAESLAAKLNNFLATVKGAEIIIRTYTKATKYAKKHVGYFVASSDNAICVRRGKSLDRIGFVTENKVRLMVALDAYQD